MGRGMKLLGAVILGVVLGLGPVAGPAQAGQLHSGQRVGGVHHDPPFRTVWRMPEFRWVDHRGPARYVCWAHR